MFNYTTNKLYLGNFPEEMIDDILELYNKIKEKFKLINKDTEILTIDNTLNNVDLILDSLNKVSDMLEMNSSFENEFCLSVSIITDIEYLINENILKENPVYIGNIIIINFFKLVYDKQDWILSNKNFNYENEYKEFLIFYDNQKEEIFDNISIHTDEYDDVSDKISNAL